jgi:hypothetical protein
MTDTFNNNDSRVFLINNQQTSKRTISECPKCGTKNPTTHWRYSQDGSFVIICINCNNIIKSYKKTEQQKTIYT